MRQATSRLSVDSTVSLAPIRGGPVPCQRVQFTPSEGVLLQVLHVSNRFLANGTGITNMLADLAFEQARNGLEVTIATPDVTGTLSDQARALQANIVGVPAPTSVASLFSLAKILRSHHKKEGFDVLHVHTVKALASALLAGGKVFSKTVATMHNVHQRSSVLMLLAAAPVAISDAHLNSLSFVPLIGKRLTVIRNGAIGSARSCTVSEVKAVDLPPKTLLYVGGLKTRKGVDLLLKNFDLVFRKVPDAHLYLVGNRDNPQIEQLASSLSAGPNIHFVDFCEDPRRYMLSASALVVPSRREAFGLVVTDARSCALPVISSDVD